MSCIENLADPCAICLDPCPVPAGHDSTGNPICACCWQVPVLGALADRKQPALCLKCKRPVDPWPLQHKGCSPKDWGWCIRNQP